MLSFKTQIQNNQTTPWQFWLSYWLSHISFWTSFLFKRNPISSSISYSSLTCSVHHRAAVAFLLTTR